MHLFTTRVRSYFVCVCVFVFVCGGCFGSIWGGFVFFFFVFFFVFFFKGGRDFVVLRLFSFLQIFLTLSTTITTIFSTITTTWEVTIHNKNASSAASLKRNSTKSKKRTPLPQSPPLPSPPLLLPLPPPSSPAPSKSKPTKSPNLSDVIVYSQKKETSSVTREQKKVVALPTSTVIRR